MILLLVGAALAAPDRLASTYVVGTSVTDIVVSPDGSWVGWTDEGAGALTILDPGTFEPSVITGLSCPGARGLAVAGDSTVGWTFYTGCDDGTVAIVEVSPDGDITLGTKLTLGEGPVEAVETDGENVYAVLAETDGATVAAVTAAGEAVEGYPVTLQDDTIEDTVVINGMLIVSHGGDEVSKVLLSSPSPTQPQSALGRTLGDAFPFPDGQDVYLADESGGLVRFQVTTSDYQAALTNVADTITAVGIEPVEGWMVLGAGEADALLYGFESAPPGTEAGVIEGAVNLTEIVTLEGYALAATTDGTVLVLTDRPWVAVEPITPAEVVDGDEITVTFSSDTAGFYKIVRGGTAEGDGTVLEDGEIEAGGEISETFTVSSSGGYEEGENRIWVFVTDGAGLVGRGASTVTVDNPPGKVSFGESAVGIGNQSFSVDFTALGVSDIAKYTIYVDVKPFTADDYPTGGPTFSGTDAITAPLEVTAEAKAKVSRTFYPVTNGTTYYIAVRATDESELEGPMSDVQSVIPEETFPASKLAGEEGGYFPPLCGTGSGAGAAVIALAAALATRRRRVVGAAAVLALGVTAAPAHAQDEDEGPRTMNVQLRYGPITIADPYVQQVFGSDPNEMLWFEYGYASRFVDLNLGIGFYQEMGWLQTASGAVSDEHDMFTIVPLSLNLTGRLDLFEEQPIVPFGRIGLDYWMWKENWYVPDPDTMDAMKDGGKYGWHFGGGLMLLLDALDRRAASRLEAVSGINDTYLVAEYRRTLLVTGENQFDLSSSEITFGLKFDF